MQHTKSSLCRETKIDTPTKPGLPVVLVIDDDPVASEIVSAVLSVAGCTVELAQGGGSALSLLDSGSCAPEVIFVDAQLPGLYGTSLIAELRTRGVSRIWLISASAPPAEMVAAAEGFLRKPFEGDELLAVMGLGNPMLAQSAAIPQVPIDSDASVLSQEVLEKFRQKMPDESVRRMYSAVLTDLKQRIQTLDAALARGDMGEVRRTGHAIRGGCGMAGAMQAAALGAQLEVIPISTSGNRSELVSAILQDLDAAVQALEGKLEAEFPA